MRRTQSRPSATAQLRDSNRIAPLTIAIAIALACALGAAACGKRPPAYPVLEAWDESGSRAIVLEPDERALWDESTAALRNLAETDRLLVEADLIRYLDRIVDDLDPRKDTATPKLAVAVRKDGERSARSFPDGSIQVTTGLLALLENEAQLAFLLAREIAHVLKRDDLAAARYAAQTPSLTARVKLLRSLETEADRWALLAMDRAGYDGAESAHALRLLHWENYGPSVESKRSRQTDLNRRLAALGEAHRALSIRGDRKGVEEYQSAIDPIRLQAAEMELFSGRPRTALACVDGYLRRHPDSAAAYTLRAKIARAERPAAHLDPSVRKDLERAVELDPGHGVALRGLGLVLRDAGESKRSGELLRRYLAAEPNAIDREIIEGYIAHPRAASPESADRAPL